MLLKIQFIRFALSGLILNFLGFVSFIILLEYLHFSPIMSASIQYPFIIYIYYLTQTYFVFDKKAKTKNVVQFLLNILFIYSLNLCALFICTEIFNLNAIKSQFFITVLLVYINYIIQKKIYN